MEYTFNGPEQLVILPPGMTVLEVQDLFSRWIDWTMIGDNSKFPLAFRDEGGSPKGDGTYLGRSFFIKNNWKIRPQEANHTLIINGNLYAETESNDDLDFMAPTVGVFRVMVERRLSNIVDMVSTSGGGSSNAPTASQNAQAVYNALEPKLEQIKQAADTAAIKADDAGAMAFLK